MCGRMWDILLSCPHVYGIGSVCLNRMPYNHFLGRKIKRSMKGSFTFFGNAAGLVKNIAKASFLVLNRRKRE